MKISSIGIDIGKTTFPLIALDEHGRIVIRRKLSVILWKGGPRAMGYGESAAAIPDPDTDKTHNGATAIGNVTISSRSTARRQDTKTTEAAVHLK